MIASVFGYESPSRIIKKSAGNCTQVLGFHRPNRSLSHVIIGRPVIAFIE